MADSDPRGRDFDEHDRPGTTAVTVINEKFAKAYFPSPIHWASVSNYFRPAIPSHVARDMEIVGISRNARYGSLTKTSRRLHTSFGSGLSSAGSRGVCIADLWRSAFLCRAVREIVRRADSRIPVSEIKTQVADIDQTISQQIALRQIVQRLCDPGPDDRLRWSLMALFLQRCRRTSEFGIRMALGAQRGKVIRMVLREVSFSAAAGVVVGLAAALATSKFVESFLYEIQRNDPLSLSAAVLVLLGAAFLGAYAPAHRASRIDPMVALRHE